MLSCWLLADIDECADGSFVCLSQQTCVNTEGSYTCVGLSGRRSTTPRQRINCSRGFAYSDVTEQCEGSQSAQTYTAGAMSCGNGLPEDSDIILDTLIDIVTIVFRHRRVRHQQEHVSRGRGLCEHAR